MSSLFRRYIFINSCFNFQPGGSFLYKSITMFKVFSVIPRKSWNICCTIRLPPIEAEWPFTISLLLQTLQFHHISWQIMIVICTPASLQFGYCSIPQSYRIYSCYSYVCILAPGGGGESCNIYKSPFQVPKRVHLDS